MYHKAVPVSEGFKFIAGKKIQTEPEIQSNLVISNLLISNYRLSQSEKSGPLFLHETMTTGNKIMWKRGEIAKELFLLFSTLFYIYISNFRS